MKFLKSCIGPSIALSLSLLLSLSTAAQTQKREGANCEQLRQFTFSWQFADQCGMRPRGGSSRGAGLTIDAEPHPGWLALQEADLKNFERDRRAILAMAGPYRTSFDFLEIVGYSNDFEPDRPYQSWGTEYVYVVEDRGDFISLQHIMVMVYQDDQGRVSEPMVMKHWRQDWQYQKRDLLGYTGHGYFETKKLPRKEVAGTWSQAVYQVDDSPRYESIGKWEHYPNFSTWISDETWRPLPRRESSVRDDYHVLIGTNRHTITPRGWLHEEANYKTVLNEQGKPDGRFAYLSKELGVNRYERLKDFDFSAGDRYWEATAPFWADVRAHWDEIIERNNRFLLNEVVDDVPLFAPLFSYAAQVYEQGRYNQNEGREFIAETLARYLNK